MSSPEAAPDESASSPTPSVPAEFAAAAEAFENQQRTMQLELLKIVWSSSFDFVKTTSQLLQALSTLLVTAYIALLAGLGKQLSLNTVPTGWIILPVALFVASLAVSFAGAALYRGESVDLTDLHSAATAFERTLEHRRMQLWAPALLLLAGIVALAYFAYLLPVHLEQPSGP